MSSNYILLPYLEEICHYRPEQALAAMDLIEVFNDPLNKVDYADAAQIFRPLILHHWQLHHLRQILQRTLYDNPSDSDNSELTEVLESLKKLLKIIKEQGMSYPYEETQNPPIHHFTWWCQCIQTIFKTFNDLRLGALRLRRLSFFVANFLNSEHYSLGPSWTNNLRWLEAHGMLRIFAYLGWLFFLPRLFRNLAILAYHVCNDQGLSPLEANLDRITRLRAHWIRIWPEVINDLYWFTSGFILCFFFYGIISPATIAINLATQIADLLCAIIKLAIEHRRWKTMEKDLETSRASPAILKSLKERMVLDEQLLLYMTLHFLILLIAMCMTLPSMAIINPIFPVIGGICAVVMTFVSHLVRGEMDHAKKSWINPPSSDKTNNGTFSCCWR